MAKTRNHNPVFDKQVADVALSRGLSRASVFCALLVAAGRVNTEWITPAEHETCFEELASVPPDVRKSEALSALCECVFETGYDVEFEDVRERHTKMCRYVVWRDLIGDPLESVLGEDE